MKAVLFPAVLGLSAFGGVMVADTLRPSAPAAHGDHKVEAATGGHAEAESGGHGSEEVKAYAGETEFLKFKRQFVVPVLKNDTVHALVLLNIGLEVSAKERDHLFRMEPRFRDAFIRELLTLSDTGYLDGDLTSPDTYEILRETLIRAANDIASEGVKDVLILDLSRQDR